jgi:hypothetical protein
VSLIWCEGILFFSLFCYRFLLISPMSSNLSWEQACRQGDQAQASRLLPDKSHSDRSAGLAWAAEHNHLSLVQFLIDKGANNWNRALANAAFGGHLPIVQLLIDKGADYWNWALVYAASGGHLPLVQLFIDKGANDWNWALACAASGGHLPVVELFIDKGANNWNTALANAAGDGHLPLVQFFIECGATEWTDECISLLKQHSDVIIAFFQTGKVPRERFAQHAPTFERQIIAFLEWQKQASRCLYDICLLPHELCALVVAY